MADEKQGAAGATGGQENPPVRSKPAMPPPSEGIKPIPLFSVAGIDVSLHPAWFIALAYFFYTGKDDYLSPVWAGIECIGLFGLVLLHEFGHAFACRSTGGKANRIMLWPLGGVAYVQPPPRPGAFLWSIAAGPLVNVVLMPVLWGFYHWGIASSWAREAPDLLNCVRVLAGINISLFVFNMLPVYPLDGGQIVQSLIWFVIGRAYSLLVVSIIGFVAAAAAGCLALVYDHVYIPFIGTVRFSQMWFVFLAVYMARRSAGAFKQAQAMIRVEKMPRVEGFACPSCGEKPFAEEIWLCDECKAGFSPFVTGNTCPHCGKIHEKVRCPFCKELSEAERWRR